MLRRLSVILFALAAVLGSLAPVPAHAATYDMIVADSMYIFCDPGNSGLTTGEDVALIVNKGASDIGATELFGSTFTATSSDPLVTCHPFINNPGPPVAPIHPDEAVGSITTYSSLLERILPGETLRNTSPLQVFGLMLDYPVGYSGTVVFNITMTMGTDVANYTLVAVITPYVHFSIYVPHAGRVSSYALPTSAHERTWGAIKKLYR